MASLTKYEWVAVFNSKLSPTKRQLISSLREGIPEMLRGDIWAYLTTAKKIANTFSQLTYLRLIEQQDEEIEIAILKDINRTFPNHSMFQNPNGYGQRGILNLLKAYSHFDRKVGYCQGMAFIAGILLMQMHSEELAFWAFVWIMQNIGWREMFTDETPKISTVLRSLERKLESEFPEVHEHILQQGVHMYCFVGIYVTIFTYKTPLDLAVRVFDWFLVEGEKAITQTVFNMMRWKSEKILLLKNEELYSYLSSRLTIECLEELSPAELVNF